jgi:4'-phosphopantetheinyl transferase
MSMAAQPNVPETALPPAFALPPGIIRVFLIEAENCDPSQIAILSPSEQQRAAAFRTPALQNLYSKAHIALRQFLSACTGMAPQDLVFTTNQWGKPALASGPHFNLSHSGDKILIALSATGPVGIDIEQIKPAPPYEIAPEAFTPEERDLLAHTEPQDRAEIFYQLWTRKEALVKAIGRGLDLGLQNITVHSNLAAAQSIANLSGPLAEAGAWHLFRLPPISGFAAALASQDDAAEIIFEI